MDRYSGMKGEWGEKIRAVIASDPTPHFVLDAHENCPFLRNDGLCEMIIGLGEGSLCEICTEHPRFYHQYPGRMEVGLGLCCEEVVRLLLDGSADLKLISDSDEKEENKCDEIALRDKIFAIFKNGKSFEEIFETTMREVDEIATLPNRRQSALFFEHLEIMEPEWRKMLERLAEYDGSLVCPDGIAYKRLTEYFLFRHFAVGGAEDCTIRAKFTFFSTMMIASVVAVTGVELAEVIRLYSTEIEYSDENVEKILDWLYEM